MDIQLSPDQKAFAQQAIDTGRLHRVEEAVQEALALWESRERRRAELLTALETAESSLMHGEGRVITERSMHDLATEISLRGRARMVAAQTATY